MLVAAVVVDDMARDVLLCLGLVLGLVLVLATLEHLLRKAAEVVTVDRRRIEVKARAEVE